MPKVTEPTLTAPEKKVIVQYRQSPPAIQKTVETLLHIPSLKVKGDTSTHLSVLLTAINNPDTLADALQHDPLAKAKAKGAPIKVKIISESANSQTFSEMLGISRQALDKRRKQGQVLALSLGRRGYAYPLWQIHQGKILTGLDQVLKALADISDWGKAIFLTTGDIRLDGATPIDYLQQQKVEEVIVSAKQYGQHTAT